MYRLSALTDARTILFKSNPWVQPWVVSLYAFRGWFKHIVFIEEKDWVWLKSQQELSPGRTIWTIYKKTHLHTQSHSNMSTSLTFTLWSVLINSCTASKTLLRFGDSSSSSWVLCYWWRYILRQAIKPLPISIHTTVPRPLLLVNPDFCISLAWLLGSYISINESGCRGKGRCVNDVSSIGSYITACGLRYWKVEHCVCTA